MEKTGITITKRKDGRYVGKFITEYVDNGKAQYHYVYGKTYEEAENKVLIGREISTRYLSGRYITVSKVYREWLNAVVNRVKESTLANYQNKFEKHILPEFGDIPCADLTAGRINAFINKKLADGLSASYVRDIFTVFKTMLKYAQEEYGFRLSLKNVVLPKAERKQVEKISDTEQKKLVSYLKANMSLTAFGILLSLFMGLRIGELCGLKWEDVDFQHKVLRIRRTVQRITSANGNRKTKIVISAPKSATSFREIAIPDMLMKYFEMFRDKADYFILSGADKIKRVLDKLIDGSLSDGGVPSNEEGSFKELYKALTDGASWHVPDHYYVLGDLESYVQDKLKVNADYKDKLAFAKKCWLNIANAGKFSSDRTIKDYAENIWKIESVKL